MPLLCYIVDGCLHTTIAESVVSCDQKTLLVKRESLLALDLQKAPYFLCTLSCSTTCLFQYLHGSLTVWLTWAQNSGDCILVFHSHGFPLLNTILGIFVSALKHFLFKYLLLKVKSSKI